MVAANARSNYHAHNAVRRRPRLDPLSTTERSFRFEFDCRTTTRYRMPGMKDPGIAEAGREAATETRRLRSCVA
jgi:hypothetical protein